MLRGHDGFTKVFLYERVVSLFIASTSTECSFCAKRHFINYQHLRKFRQVLEPSFSNWYRISKVTPAFYKRNECFQLFWGTGWQSQGNSRSRHRPYLPVSSVLLRYRLQPWELLRRTRCWWKVSRIVASSKKNLMYEHFIVHTKQRCIHIEEMWAKEFRVVYIQSAIRMNWKFKFKFSTYFKGLFYHIFSN